MAGSLGYLALSRELKRLRNFLLPKKFDPVGSYREGAKVQARTRAFVVLFHAEVESFLENWAKQLARTSETHWQKKRRISGLSAHILALNSTASTLTSTFMGEAKGNLEDGFDSNLRAAFQLFYKELKQNHGIKEENVLSMFCPLGVSPHKIDSKLLADLNSLGVTRGEHAHHSASSVINALDPEDQFQKATNLVSDLSRLDQLLQKHKKQSAI